MSRLAVIAHFWEMEREAPRTLYALHRQSCVSAKDTKVLALFGLNEVPTHMMNYWVEHVALSNSVAVMLDGARIPSPGCVAGFQMVLEDDPSSFVYTLPLHLGPGNQSITCQKGYDQEEEDRLLASVPWQANGYKLFNISSHCGALGDPGKGFWAGITESCFFAVSREAWMDLGGYDERFKSPGGGLANLELFARFQRELNPVCLLGEATFHQFHNGISSNVPRAERPTEMWNEEYESIFGKPFHTEWVEPDYAGIIRPEARWAFE